MRYSVDGKGTSFMAENVKICCFFVPKEPSPWSWYWLAPFMSTVLLVCRFESKDAMCMVTLKISDSRLLQHWINISLGHDHMDVEWLDILVRLLSLWQALIFMHCYKQEDIEITAEPKVGWIPCLASLGSGVRWLASMDECESKVVPYDAHGTSSMSVELGRLLSQRVFLLSCYRVNRPSYMKVQLIVQLAMYLATLLSRKMVIKVFNRDPSALIQTFVVIEALKLLQRPVLMLHVKRLKSCAFFLERYFIPLLAFSPYVSSAVFQSHGVKKDFLYKLPLISLYCGALIRIFLDSLGSSIRYTLLSKVFMDGWSFNFLLLCFNCFGLSLLSIDLLARTSTSTPLCLCYVGSGIVLDKWHIFYKQYFPSRLYKKKASISLRLSLCHLDSDGDLFMLSRKHFSRFSRGFYFQSIWGRREQSLGTSFGLVGPQATPLLLVVLMLTYSFRLCSVLKGLPPTIMVLVENPSVRLLLELSLDAFSLVLLTYSLLGLVWVWTYLSLWCAWAVGSKRGVPFLRRGGLVPSPLASTKAGLIIVLILAEVEAVELGANILSGNWRKKP
ncbi:hypothetical protein Tco_0117839 [Tanacetum coccineum]